MGTKEWRLHLGTWRPLESLARAKLFSKQEILGGMDTKKMGGGEGGGDSNYSQLFCDFAWRRENSSVYKLAMKIPLSSTELVAVTSTRTVKWLLLRPSSLQIHYFNEAKLLDFSQIWFTRLSLASWIWRKLLF